ncbi:MAG: LCP family protein [Marmoricola sp.]
MSPVEPVEPVEPPRHRLRYLKIAAWVSAGLVLLLVAGGGWVYLRLNANIRSVDPGRDLGTDRPPSFPGVLDVLVIGTDSRQGLGNRYGDDGSVGHADTNLLVHVSADRSNATVISIPRDLMVAIPDCYTASGQRVPGSPRDMFNVSLGQEGRRPGCVMKTVEDLTGIRVDHFVQVDFNAVKTMSDALGGVPVCTTEPIDDVKSGLHLVAGHDVLKGEQALAFVRTRHGVGFGSDLDRIKLQQQFVASMIRKIKSTDTLTNPKKLISVADAATKALTVDPDISSLRSLTGLALEINQVDSAHITFTTVPVLDSPLAGESGRLVLQEPAAHDLFAWVAGDHALSSRSRPGRTGTTPSGSPSGPASTPGAHPPTGLSTLGADQPDCAG